MQILLSIGWFYTFQTVTRQLARVFGSECDYTYASFGKFNSKTTPMFKRLRNCTTTTEAKLRTPTVHANEGEMDGTAPNDFASKDNK